MYKKIYPIGFVPIICILLFMHTTAALADSAGKLVKKGNTAFAAGKYDEALESYEEAGVDDPESAHIYFNKGAALYKKDNFSGAKDAFKQASVKSKDFNLEAKSKFNLGLCSVREAERQQDSDMKKALEAYGEGIRYFQEALVLDPEFSQAAENIEVVRLMMKSILDEIKKQEEAAKNQQEQMENTANKMKELIQQQEALLGRNEALNNEKKSGGPSNDLTNDLKNRIKNIADAQGQLKDETQTLSDSLAGQGQNALDSGQQSKLHLDNSTKEQDAAVEKLDKNETETAGKHQQASLKSLKDALESMEENQNEQCQKPQQGQDQKQKQGQDQQQKQDTDKPDKDQDSEGEEQKQATAVQMPDNADSILDEEKENKKQRMQHASGGYRKVDKDW